MINRRRRLSVTPPSIRASPSRCLLQPAAPSLAAGRPSLSQQLVLVGRPSLAAVASPWPQQAAHQRASCIIEKKCEGNSRHGRPWHGQVSHRPTGGCRGSRAGLEGEGKHGGDGRPASRGNPAWAGEGKHGGDGQPSLGGSSVATAPSLMLSWRRRCFLLGGERQRRGSKLNPTGPNGPTHVEGLPDCQPNKSFLSLLDN